MKWNVYVKDWAGGKTIETFHCQVEADTSSHACDWVCQVDWISRNRLVAYSADEPVVLKGVNHENTR